MKILLISPLPKLDPACGDVTYTQTLLSHPPADVVYETYAEALARGTLREHGNLRALGTAFRRRAGSAPLELMLTVGSVGLNRLRRSHLLFSEPFRFFSVKPGEYDLIHLHAISANIVNLRCPLVVSNSAPLRYLYTEARCYSRRRVALVESMEIGLGRLMRMNVNSYFLPQATIVLAMTEYLKGWYLRRGIQPKERVRVAPFYLPSQAIGPAAARRPKRVGFVAKDFDSKGGPILLRAFKLVRTQRPDAELWIVGSPPPIDRAAAAADGISWFPFVPRETLLKDILPSLDVFAYPTHFDGLPLVVLEAMAMGIAIATSDYQAMPEVVEYGAGGLISPVNDVGALATNILRLLEPDGNARYRAAARDAFERRYSANAVRPKLLEAYQDAVVAGQRRRGIRATATEPRALTFEDVR